MASWLGLHHTANWPWALRFLRGPGKTFMALKLCFLHFQAVMHAGCAASDNLIVESVCSRNLEDNVRTQWSCHGRWRTEDHRQMLVLSTPFFTSTSRAISEANSMASASNFVCLSYTERDGIFEASASPNSCQLPGTASSYQR